MATHFKLGKTLVRIAIDWRRWTIGVGGIASSTIGRFTFLLSRHDWYRFRLDDLRIVRRMMHVDTESPENSMVAVRVAVDD